MTSEQAVKRHYNLDKNIEKYDLIANVLLNYQILATCTLPSLQSTYRMLETPEPLNSCHCLYFQTWSCYTV